MPFLRDGRLVRTIALRLRPVSALAGYWLGRADRKRAVFGGQSRVGLSQGEIGAALGIPFKDRKLERQTRAVRDKKRDPKGTPGTYRAIADVVLGREEARVWKMDRRRSEVIALERRRRAAKRRAAEKNRRAAK